MMKVLKLYDSEEEALKAITLFKNLKLINDNPLDENKSTLQNQPFFKVNEKENFYVLANEVVLSKNGKYPERAEFVGINNIIFIFVQVLLTASVFIKIYLMIQKQELLWADVLVLLLLLMLWPLPLKYFNKYCRFN